MIRVRQMRYVRAGFMSNEERGKLRDIVAKTSKADQGTSDLSQELLAWARGQFTEEEIVAGLREGKRAGRN